MVATRAGSRSVLGRQMRALIVVMLAGLALPAVAATGIGSSTDIKVGIDKTQAIGKAMESGTAASKGKRTSDAVADQKSIARSKKDGATDSVQLALDVDAYYLPVVQKLQAGIPLKDGTTSAFYQYCQLLGAVPLYAPSNNFRVGCFSLDRMARNIRDNQAAVEDTARCMLGYALVAQAAMREVSATAYASPQAIKSGAPGAMEEAVGKVLNSGPAMSDINATIDSVACSVDMGTDGSKLLTCTDLFLATPLCKSRLGGFTVDPATWTAKLGGLPVWPAAGGYLGVTLQVAVAASKGTDASATVQHTASTSRDSYTDKNASVGSKVSKQLTTSKQTGRSASSKSGVDTSIPGMK